MSHLAVLVSVDSLLRRKLDWQKIITTEEVDDKIRITPAVRSISGSFILAENFDYKKDLTEALTEKYLKNG